MGRMKFAGDTPAQRLIAGVIGVVGLMAALVVGAVATGLAVEYLGAEIVAFALGIWMAAAVYSKVWDRWSPWARETEESK